MRFYLVGLLVVYIMEKLSKEKEEDGELYNLQE
jgi:hypothetical protein